VGGVVVGTAIRRIGELPTIAWALIAAGVGVGLLAFAELWIVLVSWVFVGVAVSFYNVAFVTLVQRRTDVAMQGRVMAAIDAAFTVPFALSLAFGALIVGVVDFRTVYLVEGVAFIAIALYLAVTIRTRKVTQPTPSTGRTRRRERVRSSSRDARALAAPPQRSPGRHPTP
jgi:MFS family permease